MRHLPLLHFRGPAAEKGARSRRAVFLDRDGVINQVVFRDGLPASPRKVHEFVFEIGVEAALEILAASGFWIFVTTNQPDLARGLLRAEVHQAISDRLLEHLPVVDAIAICPHDDRDACACRKPRPGLLLELSRREDLEMGESWMIGDSARDSEAARRAGCRSILLERWYNRGVWANFHARTLFEATEIILRTGNRYGR